jgi:predicted ATPase
MEVSLAAIHCRPPEEEAHQRKPYSSPVAGTPSFELVGRDGERAKLVDFVGRLSEGPSALLIRGEPGIGKTILWREGIADAQREGVRVLVSRCAEAEMPIPLGAVSDLLDPVFDDVADELAEAQRYALSTALGIESDPRGRPDRLALMRAVVSALRAFASDAPFLLAIDDVQWLDPASARVLSFAVRRVDEEPIGILATLRGGADEPDPLALADALGPGAFAELTVGSLGLQSLQQLLRQRFDVRLPRSKVAALHAASGGNPMFALEFARSVEREKHRCALGFPCQRRWKSWFENAFARFRKRHARSWSSSPPSSDPPCPCSNRRSANRRCGS